MHELDYNQLKETLWDNEVALLNAYKNLKARCLSIEEQINHLEKQKDEVGERSTKVEKRLVELSLL
jgi:hypothetical protein